MAKARPPFRRGPPPVYPDVGWPSYGGYQRTPYPKKVGLLRDPRMLMEYRRPAFIAASTLRRFTQLELFSNMTGSRSLEVLNYFGSMTGVVSSGMEKLKPDLSGLQSLGMSTEVPSPDLTQYMAQGTGLAKEALNVAERISQKSNPVKTIVKKIFPKKKKKKRRVPKWMR